VTKKTKRQRSVLRNDTGKSVATIGSGNVWQDLGFEDPEREEAKARLVLKIAIVIDGRCLTQERAGKIIGLSQPKLSRLLRGHWQSYSLDRLTRYLTRLGVTVRLSFEDRPRGQQGKLLVPRVGSRRFA
jgi:predicted XRE-type DNA-binding protein